MFDKNVRKNRTTVRKAKNIWQETKMYTYQKTLLYSVKNLKMAIRNCQKLLEYMGISSKYSDQDCAVIAGKMLKIVEQRQKLIRLKGILKNIVLNFTLDEKKLFARKYLGKKQVFNNFSERQYYRNQNKLIKNFSDRLKNFGLNEEKFKREYLSIPYINSIYRLVKEKERTTRPQRSFL